MTRIKRLAIRSFTGLLYVAAIVGALFIHPYTFLLFFSLIVGCSIYEFYSLVKKDFKKEQILLGVVSGVLFFCASFFYAAGKASFVIYLPSLFLVLLTLISGLYYRTENPVVGWALSLFIQLYCAGSLALLNFIVFAPNETGQIEYLPQMAFLIFFFLWISDTGAYLVGSMFGRHRLFPRISPLKSWEGFWGGLVCALLFSLLCGFFCSFLPWYHWLALSAIIVVFGTWGDLVESLIKRTFDVKDSGSILPGHGGVLDRLDSALLAIPAVLLYIFCFIRN